MGKNGRPGATLDDYLYWQEGLKNREASGLSIDEFCIAEEVSRSTFYRWQQRLREGIPDSVREEGEIPTLADLAEPKFLPISLRASPVEIEFRRDIKQCVLAKVDGLFGGSRPTQRRPAATITKSDGRKAVLAKYLKQMPRPCILMAKFKGRIVKAGVRSDGTVRFAGKIYTSPSLAAAVACKRKTCNGWRFWRYERTRRLGPARYITALNGFASQ